MKCVNCQKELMPGMTFCPYCNTKQPVASPKEAPKLVTPTILKKPNEGLQEQKKEETNIPKAVQEPAPLKTEDIPKPLMREDTEPVFLDLPEDEEPEIIPEPAKKEIKPTDISYEEEESDWLPAEKDISEEILDSASIDVNEDGYYDAVPPKTEETFPVSRGEFIAKIVFLVIAVLLVGLYLAYVIR